MTHMPEFIHATYQGPDKGDYAKKAQITLDGLANHPEDREYILAYAVIFLKYAEQYERAIEVARQALPELQDAECRTTVLRFLAHSLEAVGQPEAAIEVRLQTLAITDNLRLELTELAASYEQLGDADNAIRYYEELITAEEEACDTDVYTKLANLYEAKKDFVNVGWTYERAARSHTYGNAWLWFNTGRGAALAGNDEEAIFYLRMVLKMAPDDAGAHYFLGQIFQNGGDVYRAMHHYTEALKIQPEYPEVYNNLATISFNEESDISGAIKNIEVALEQNPDPRLLITLYRNLAILYDKIADYDLHEYYKGKMLEAIGFPVSFSDEDDEEEEEPTE